MAGLTGKYLFIFSYYADIQEVTVLAVLGGFKLPTQTEGRMREARNWVKIKGLLMIVWT